MNRTVSTRRARQWQRHVGHESRPTGLLVKWARTGSWWVQLSYTGHFSKASSKHSSFPWDSSGTHRRNQARVNGDARMDQDLHFNRPLLCSKRRRLHLQMQRLHAHVGLIRVTLP